jgi:O-antigen/teichoic acid export membrane protein
MSNFGINHLDKIIISSILGSAQLGVYALNMALANVVLMIATASSTLLTITAKDNSEDKSNNHLWSTVVLLELIIIVLLVFVSADTFGLISQFLSSLENLNAEIFAVLLIATGLQGISTMTLNFYAARFDAQALNYLTVPLAALAVVLTFYGVGRFGANGAAGSLLAINFVSAMIFSMKVSFQLMSSVIVLTSLQLLYFLAFVI